MLEDYIKKKNFKTWTPEEIFTEKFQYTINDSLEKNEILCHCIEEDLGPIFPLKSYEPNKQKYNNFFGQGVYEANTQTNTLLPELKWILVKSTMQFYGITEKELIRIVKYGSKNRLIKEKNKEIFGLFDECMGILNNKIEDRRQIENYKQAIIELQEKNIQIPSLPMDSQII